MRTEQINKIREIVKGISGSGDLLRQFGDLLPKNTPFVLEAGDFTRHDENGGSSISAPIAADVWYLRNHDNLIVEYDTEDYVEQSLKFLDEKLGGIKPLRGIEDPTQLMVQSEETGWYSEVKDYYSNVAQYWIQQLVYEFGFFSQGITVDSERPESGDKKDLLGYIAIPVGQFGVMEVISIFFESETEEDGFSLESDETPVTYAAGDAPLFPPTDGHGQNKCFGKHLIETGYLVPNDVKDVVERFLPQFESSSFYPIDVKPKNWMRYWLKEQDLFPVPGEFVGILLRPIAVPPHAWWFQESCPFLYAGCWWENEWCSSGVVTERTLEEDREDGKDGDEYKVRVHGVEITLYTTDFFRYEVDERVAIVKLDNVLADKPEKPFNNVRQAQQWDKEADETYEDYILMPISFYKEV